MSTSISKPLSRVIREVREYIEEHGWHRGDYVNDQGNVCVIGGFIATQIPGTLDDVDDESASVAICLLLDSDLGIDFYELFGKVTSAGSVTEWNDVIAEDQEHVIQTLKEMETRCVDD